jgi:S-formylglutathione hydrolase
MSGGVESISGAGSGLEVMARIPVAGGTLIRFKHQSTSTGTPMTAAVFIPPGVEYSSDIPAIYWLSGLTCTDENFSQKAGAFAHAARERIALVIPDTSPRGAGIEGEDASWDFGTGAGFYLDATEQPWSKNYNMYTYITKELPALVEREFRISPHLRSISGHSMGGHGALTIAFKDGGQSWVSVSAFAPICNPTECAWGQKVGRGFTTIRLRTLYSHTNCISISYIVGHVYYTYASFVHSHQCATHNSMFGAERTVHRASIPLMC